VSKYHVDIVQNSNGTTIVRAAGSLKLAAAAIKEGLAEISGKEGDFNATFVELENVDGAEKRQVLRLTAEADIVATVLKKRLAAEKKSEDGGAESGADQADASGE